MELAFSSLLYLVTSLLILLLSLCFIEKKVTRSEYKLPPGPWTLPFIGSLHHLATTSLPHHALRDLAGLYGPVMFFRAGETDMVVITSREAAEEVTFDRNDFMQIVHKKSYKTRSMYFYDFMIPLPKPKLDLHPIFVQMNGSDSQIGYQHDSKVMKTNDSNLANRPTVSAANVFMYGSTDIAFSNGPYWRQLRRICISELLISKRVKSFFSIRQEEINSMLKSWSLVSDKTPVNLSAKTYELSNNIIIRAAFGGMCKHRGLFLEIIAEVVELLSGFNLSDMFPSLSWLDLNTKRRLARLHSKLDLVLEEVMQEHLKKQQQNKKGGDSEEIEFDLVDVLINVKERGDLEVPITTDNIKAVIMDVISAGTETSSTTIVWAMTELIKHPAIMAKTQTEIRQAASENTKFDVNSSSYLKQVIKETLRLHPPAPLLLPRLCKENCQVLGYTIPSGARVVVNAWALGRNPDCWKNPEEFDPGRFEESAIDFKGKNYEFVPFGAGRRICPGLEFGVAVVEEALARFLLHFDWKLPDGMKPDDVDMTETLGLVSAKKEPLCLIPVLQVPLPDMLPN